MTAGPGPAGSPRSAVVTSQSLRPPVALVMACWHWNRQFTQPPAPARRRRVDMNVATTSAAATATLAVATSTATITAAMLKKWEDRYFLIGPYNPNTAAIEFEERPTEGFIRQTLDRLRDSGMPCHFGNWLVAGRPKDSSSGRLLESTSPSACSDWKTMPNWPRRSRCRREHSRSFQSTI